MIGSWFYIYWQLVGLATILALHEMQRWITLHEMQRWVALREIQRWVALHEMQRFALHEMFSTSIH